MLALKITDVKDFMNKLLIGEVFDRFSLLYSVCGDSQDSRSLLFIRIFFHDDRDFGDK